MTEGSNRFEAPDPMMALNNRFFRRYRRDNHRRPLEPSSLDSVRHPDLDRAAVSELSGGDLFDSGRAARSRHRAIVAFRSNLGMKRANNPGREERLASLSQTARQRRQLSLPIKALRGATDGTRNPDARRRV